MAYLTREPIDISEVVGRGGFETCPYGTGASVLFLGIVRKYSEGKRVTYLEYEAYEEMAEQRIQALVDSALQSWPLEGIQILHRLGRVDLGEIAVAIDVRSTHRNEAYQASRYLIEEIKQCVPIWKKEYFEDGTSEWSLCGSYAELSRSV